MMISNFQLPEKRLLQMSGDTWKQEKLERMGLKLAAGEKINRRWNDISLTIPSMDFGEIGTLVSTNQRFVFLVYGDQYAYTHTMQGIGTFESKTHPAFKPEEAIAWLQFSPHSGEKFSFQASTRSISEIIAEISSNEQYLTSVSTTRKTARKIIGSAKPSTPIQETSGMQGIQRITQAAIDERSNTVTGALQDLNSLKTSAQKLIEIAEELSRASDTETATEMSKICLAIGITKTASTGKSENSSQAVSLANEFSQVMSEWLKQSTCGILTVAEAYAAYNRMRGNDLISPHDLQEALGVIESGGYPVRVEKIGETRVVLRTEVSFDAVIGELISSLEDNKYITPMMIQRKTGLPNSLAKDYLVRAEQQGILARDDSLAGLRFYVNRFDKFDMIEI